MKKYKDYILVFDSGLGGISILQGLVKELPYEKFVYFDDSANAPYGDKTAKEIADSYAECRERQAGDILVGTKRYG